MDKRTNVIDFLKSLFFLLYFVILTAERIISLVSMAVDTGQELFWDFFYFETYSVVVTVLAIIGGWGYLLIRGRKLLRLTAPKKAEDFLQPSIAAGILLLGGMVHTYGTVSPIQFAAYGCLLASMGIFTAECVKGDGKARVRWLSFAYITAFSMSIPVVYDCIICGELGCNLCSAFGLAEAISSIGLTAAFTYMLYSFYKKDSVSSFSPIIIILAIIGDGLVLFFGWHGEEINYFVLVSVCAAAVLWVIGKVVSVRGKD